MSNCIECSWLDGQRCSAFPDDWPDVPINHVRACTVAINRKYCEQIRPGHRILEIGVGHWSPVREHCLESDAQWDGIDVEKSYLGKPTIATRIESVERLSFDDDVFDFVISTQALEHWSENGTRVELGLWECFRVCKPAGWVLMNVPIHVHGSRGFVAGDVAAIRRMFEPYSSLVRMETWRKKSQPLPDVHLIPSRFTRGEPAHNLDIYAQARDHLPPRPRPYRIRNRLFRDFVDHRPGYFAYLVLRRIGRFARRLA